MSIGPDEGDPILDLREIVGEDEPLVPMPPEPSVAPLLPQGQDARPTSGSVAPPPLPARRSGASSRVPAHAAISGAFPAQSSILAIPPPSPRASGDPFQEPAEPRLPRGLPEEKLEYFRTVLKQKQETLARARAVHAERDAEADSLREAANALKAQLEAALADLARLRDLPAKLREVTEAYERDRPRMEQSAATAANLSRQLAELQFEFDGSVEERKLLSKALAEVEVQVPKLTEKLEVERASRASIADELVDAKEALNHAQSQVAELEAKKSEVEGNLEAIQEQYQEVSAENEQLSQQVERATEELKTLAAERDAAIAERDAARGDMDSLNARMHDLEREVAQATDTAQEQARHRVHEAQARAAALGSELEQLKTQVTRLQNDKAQLKTQAEQFAKKLKEELTSSSQRKIGELQTALMGEEEKRTALEEQVRESEKKAAGWQAAFQKEQREREAAEREAESSREQLEQQLATLEETAAGLRAEAELGRSAPAELVAETDKLKSDLAAMKKKLMSAETAMEVAASLKAKVARLEAQLKGKK